jgi:hypothetical protein
MDYQRCTAYIIEIYATDPNEGCKIVVYRLQIMEICMYTTKFRYGLNHRFTPVGPSSSGIRHIIGSNAKRI